MIKILTQVNRKKMLNKRFVEVVYNIGIIISDSQKAVNFYAFFKAKSKHARENVKCRNDA
ncbi:hypothetical protein HMP0721_1732 [Pseudoramibacter alactolyticus ATCC 23263]|uniref:Uncharacterized protein n=1 Tax=Pseudoramibacter alactolyticus ATCC 23263 TaxID=887929 RepID=E6MI27_9FIRM|nr:hypothetical protein HMP0721_1732 [Pseudoramibacter alactolyticus ATCC 23263]